MTTHGYRPWSVYGRKDILRLGAAMVLVGLQTAMATPASQPEATNIHAGRRATAQPAEHGSLKRRAVAVFALLMLVAGGATFVAMRPRGPCTGCGQRNTCRQPACDSRSPTNHKEEPS